MSGWARDQLVDRVALVARDIVGEARENPKMLEALAGGGLIDEQIADYEAGLPFRKAE